MADPAPSTKWLSDSERQIGEVEARWAFAHPLQIKELCCPGAKAGLVVLEVVTFALKNKLNWANTNDLMLAVS